MMNKKIYKWIAYIITAAIAFTCLQASLSLPVHALSNYSPNVDINSEAVYMVNLDGEQPTVVYEKNAELQMQPASLTKIMTTIIALEELADQDISQIMVTAPDYIYDEFAGINVSTADIRRGETLSMQDLIHATMLQSACEGASIIADYIGGGSISAFVEKMNAKAAEIGAKNTVFKNAHGLDDPGQLTTAKDIYLITMYALKNVDGFEEIACKTRYEMASTNIHTEPRYVLHSNLMMDKTRGGEKYYYQYVKGIKTGSLDSVGKNLVSMAAKDGYNYMLVTMGAPNTYPDGTTISDNLSFIDAKIIYEWAFSEFGIHEIVSKNESVKQVSVRLAWDKDTVLLKPKNDVSALLPKDIDIKTNVQMVFVDMPEFVNAPVTEGQVIGKMQLKISDEVIGEVDLVAAETIESSTILNIGEGIKNFLGSIWLKVILGIIIFIILAYIILSIVYNRKRRRRKYTKKKNKRRKR